MKKKTLFMMVIAAMTCCLSANAQVVTDQQDALTPEQIQQQQATREAQLEEAKREKEKAEKFQKE